MKNSLSGSPFENDFGKKIFLKHWIKKKRKESHLWKKIFLKTYLFLVKKDL